MKAQAGDSRQIGNYMGELAENYRESDFLARLAELAALVSGPGSRKISSGRNLNVKLTLTCGGRPVEVMVKSFGRQFFAKDWIDRVRGSKAQRSWKAASALHTRGVGTPPPIGFLDRWRGARLVESYFLSEFQHDVTCFRDELIRLFRDDPECWKFMDLMKSVAGAIRAMHDAGIMHNDLGNQNILLRRGGESGWSDVQFIDLNRARVGNGPLPEESRARDISRIYLPSDLLRVFKEMYYGDVPPPAGFQRRERFCRRLYAIHSATRRFRHPVRTMLERRAGRRDPVYPSEKDMWIWDERSAQAISVMRPKDRRKFYPASRSLQQARVLLSGLGPVWKEYKTLLAECYGREVPMKDRVGVAVNLTPESCGRELSPLGKLGTIPLLLRFHHHESAEQLKYKAFAARRLHEAGHKVSVALVQDRRAVTDPASWKSFVSAVLDQVAGVAELVEIGHAINRVKWGIWGFEEYRSLVEGAAAAAGQSKTRFMGPAVIDFEYPFLMAALRFIPPGMRFDALSHHLYVDRRGAPENRQGWFSALEKFALARAIARWSGVCDDRLVVSEVSWPLKGTGVYSPVTSPYESPGPRFDDPSVSEDDYADYMLRYLLTAICSGMVERVFWWRLVARGFGLVDDSVPGEWRERPALRMLAYFLSILGESTFAEKLPAQEGAHLFMFNLRRNARVCVAYSSAGDVRTPLPFEWSRVVDATGEKLAQRPPESGGGGMISLSGRPVYVFSV